MGWAKSVTQCGWGVDVLVGRGDGVIDGTGVLVTVGMRLGVGVFEIEMGVIVDGGADESALHDKILSVIITLTRAKELFLESLLMS